MAIFDCLKNKKNVNMLKERDLHPLGGAIFIIDTSSNGEYKLYDKDKVETFDPEKAVYYEVIRKGDKDKYFVVDNKTGFVTLQRWCYYEVQIGGTSTNFGTGRTNTQKILNTPDTGIYPDYRTPSIWETVREHNANAVNGCDDWYIGSKDELQFLVTSPAKAVKKMFKPKSKKEEDKIAFFSSSEQDHPNIVWAWGGKHWKENWHREVKQWAWGCCLIRSF